VVHPGGRLQQRTAFQPDLTPQRLPRVAVKWWSITSTSIAEAFLRTSKIKMLRWVSISIARKNARCAFRPDLENLGNTLELIDFGGLFSCNDRSVAPTYVAACNKPLDAGNGSKFTRTMATMHAILATFAYHPRCYDEMDYFDIANCHCVDSAANPQSVRAAERPRRRSEATRAIYGRLGRSQNVLPDEWETDCNERSV
jgi:hypothetical protein